MCPFGGSLCPSANHRQFQALPRGHYTRTNGTSVARALKSRLQFSCPTTLRQQPPSLRTFSRDIRWFVLTQECRDAHCRQPLHRHHIPLTTVVRESRCLFSAAADEVISFQTSVGSCSHFRMSSCASPAAVEHLNSSHGRPLSRAHLRVSRWLVLWQHTHKSYGSRDIRCLWPRCPAPATSVQDRVLHGHPLSIVEMPGGGSHYTCQIVSKTSVGSCQPQNEASCP